MNNLTQSIIQTAITTFVMLIGKADLFERIKNRIELANADMPDATGADKRHKVLADLEIIFEDLIEPIAESVIRMLLELGVVWLKNQVARD